MAGRRFPVEAGHVLAFGRALGAADPPNGLPAAGDAAPLTFAIAGAQFDPEYPLRPRPGAPWHGSGGDAGLVTEGPAACTRNSTSSITARSGSAMSWYRRAWPGEQWEKQGRSGRLRFREHITEFRDETGELVVTARSVSVLRAAS